MKLDKKWLEDSGACSDGKKWFLAQNERDAKKVIQKLMEIDRFDWANWAIVRCMTHERKIEYAIYAAELVIENYEKMYPENKAPRKAIEAAKDYLKNPCEQTNSAAASAAFVAASAADSADSAADSAASAAYSAAYSAASAAASAASAAASAAYSAAYSASRAAASAAASAASAVKTKIIKYGLTLIGE